VVEKERERERERKRERERDKGREKEVTNIVITFFALPPFKKPCSDPIWTKAPS